MEGAHREPLTVEQAAQRLGVGEATIRSWMAQRRLAYHKIGRRVFLDGRDVEQVWARGRVEAATSGERA